MENNVERELNGLMQKLEGFMTTKTVVGEPIHIENTILVPLIDVSFAAATGSKASNKFTERRKEREKKVEGGTGAGAGGLGAKVTPSAILVIQNGTTQLINVRNQDSTTKLIDMIPGLVAKVPEWFGKLSGSDSSKESNKKSDDYHELEHE